MKLKKYKMRHRVFFVVAIIINASIYIMLFNGISWLAALSVIAQIIISLGMGAGLMYVESFIIYDKWINALKLEEGQIWKKHTGPYYVYIEVQQPLNKKQIMVKRWVKDYKQPLRLSYSPMSGSMIMTIRQDKAHFHRAGWMALEGKEKAKFLLKT